MIKRLLASYICREKVHFTLRFDSVLTEKWDLYNGATFLQDEFLYSTFPFQIIHSLQCTKTVFEVPRFTIYSAENISKRGL